MLASRSQHHDGDGEAIGFQRVALGNEICSQTPTEVVDTRRVRGLNTDGISEQNK